MKDVIIIGASGHGKVIADIIEASGDKVVGFLDDDSSKAVLGQVADYDKFDAEFVIAIGNPEIRERIANSSKCKWYTAVHPTAVVSPSAVIGEGTVVMPNAVINADAVMGKHCIVNTAAVVEHDNKLGGTVSVGDRTWIGIGASVSNNIKKYQGSVVFAIITKRFQYQKGLHQTM